MIEHFSMFLQIIIPRCDVASARAPIPSAEALWCRNFCWWRPKTYIYIYIDIYEIVQLVLKKNALVVASRRNSR